MDINQDFFMLLRLGLGLNHDFSSKPTPDEWAHIYQIAQNQSLLGITYNAINSLEPDIRPPMDISIQLTIHAENIRGYNKLMNAESARLTSFFEAQGHNTVILKGQANARLYPDVLSRQPGDIDIYVDGGQVKVIQMLLRTGLMEYMPHISYEGKLDKPTKRYHHVHLPPNESGIDVEVHFRPSSGNAFPFTNRRIQSFLLHEIKNTDLVPEGFRVPSIKFALIMQLSHIQRHFLNTGIGLRQICDYYIILKKSTTQERTQVAELLKKFGLKNMAGALMWLLGQVFLMDKTHMLCEPDSYRGEWLLREVMERGNFGHYSPYSHLKPWKRIIKNRLRHIRLLRFNFNEELWIELGYWKYVIITIPERIRRRSFSLAEQQD
ncbi:MAG: nucleotidyltransferase family protein [Bacteroidaceae bacterium]|nr:nucleotidyltransferase family protein [Bacteroidaceae bacterium]